MVSFNKCIVVALIGSVMLTAVLADQGVEVPDVAGDAAAALKGTQDAAQGAAQKAQEGAQRATSGILGLGAKLYNTVKDTGSSILSHIPFMHSANKTETAAPEAAAPAVAEQKKEEEAAAPATTAAPEAEPEAETETEAAQEEPAQEQEEQQEQEEAKEAEKPKKEADEQ